MKLAYICTNYNNSSFTLNAVNSIMLNLNHEIEVFVVDNASGADDAAFLKALASRYSNVHIIHSPDNVGYFAGLNIGIEALRQRFPEIQWVIAGNNDLEFPFDFCDKLQKNMARLSAHSVISPDIVTPDGKHQNPHVIAKISTIRQIFYDLYHSNYYLGSLIYLLTKTFLFTWRRRDEDEWQTPSSIDQGHGSCYVLTPKFFKRFIKLCSPTFMMGEEFFLQMQLKDVGEQVYYDPCIRLKHCWHGSLANLPSRRRWEFARDAHREYRKHVRLFGQRNMTTLQVKNDSSKHARNTYRICINCVMDTTDSQIRFNANGVCDHCTNFKTHVVPNWFPNEIGKGLFRDMVQRIKLTGKGKQFDCIMGVSGGLDSSYLLHLAVKEFDLRPLVFHVDGGWNTDLAVNNIQMLVDKLGLDLYTEVINWQEMRDFQLSFFKSGVPHLDIPQDHAFIASLYHFANKYKIKYILNGGNFATECVRNPKEWLYYGTDLPHLRDIQAQFGTRPLDTYPFSGILFHKFYLRWIKGIRVVKPLNYLPYTKEDASQVLSELYDWRPYPQKHFESRFTRFYESYWLPTRFGYDTRRVQYSSLILTGQMKREEALSMLEKPAYNPKTIDEDFAYIATKLGITAEALRGYHQMPLKSYRDYKNQERMFDLGAKVLQRIGIERAIKR